MSEQQKNSFSQEDRQWSAIAKRTTGQPLSDEERLLIDQWVNEDDQNEQMLSDLERLDVSMPLPDSMEAYNEFSTICHKQKRRKIIRYASIAACLLVMIGVGIYFVPRSSETPLRSQMVIDVPAGEKTNIVLYDGTRVALNNASRLVIDEFDKENRIVRLDGEAYFEVAPDKVKPFIVVTDKMDIKVLGTKFNIKSYRNEDVIEASLFEGSIEAISRLDNSNMVLKPNQKLKLYKSTQYMELITIKDMNAASWKSGELIFDGIPLRIALNTIERAYNTQLFLADSIIADKPLFGKFVDNEDLTTILKVICEVYEMKYTAENKTLSLLKNK